MSVEKPPMRFWSNVGLPDETGCMPWLGGKNTYGYGRSYFGGAHHMAHRVAYEQAKGSIPEGLQVDHLCRVRHCVNPDHMEAVTPGENTRRGIRTAQGADYQRSKTHCPQGHPYSGDNVYRNKRGARRCRECLREQQRRSYRRKKEC